MARIRTVKPELFLDEELGALSGDHLALFVGLFTLADKEGRLEDRPVRIKASLFPYRAVDVTALITDLEAIGKVGRYGAGDESFLVVWTFKKHQRPHPKEPASIIPEPPSREKKRPAVFRSACIPSSPVGRGGKGREGDLGREPERASALAPSAAVEAVERIYRAATGQEFSWGLPNGPEERAVRALEAQHGETLPALLAAAFDPSWPQYGSLAKLLRGGAEAVNELRAKAAKLRAKAGEGRAVVPTASFPVCAACGGPNDFGAVWDVPLCVAHGPQAIAANLTSEAAVRAWLAKEAA